MVALIAAVLPSVPAAAETLDRREVERSFQAWIATDAWPLATAAGVARTTFDRAFKGVTLDWNLPELQPPGQPIKEHEIEWQTEFRSPAPYFGEAGLKTLARQGRSRLAKWRKTLDAVEARYGVPAEILVAIWGKESGFGEVKLPEPAIRALATQAFMGRRGAFYRKELIAALQILENGDISPEGMRSSWAGGLGQPQFLPSLYLVYAVDFDGDGHRDIWDSVPDTLASIANFLANEGWRRGEGWAFEATLPANVSCALEGPERGRPLAEWARLGLTRADGGALPSRGDDAAFLLMPAGRLGPAFMVTGNFYVLKQYNRSDLYALYVGHLADRFGEDRPFRGTWTSVGGISRGDVRRLQERLVAEGHDVGGTDGLVGSKTRVAVGMWQAERSLPVTCLPDTRLIRGLD
ncbi:MAG: lytic murein transglycosylase [Bauldia sp.]